ncbi:hypothetical protein HX109_08260 [Galbibacter sp. BG1]|uniref:hypothetical protein n=1 Tax=Galbibacter sp. BG1 TaxID=1170699 RepID=UPI0015C062E0|nr:hypothetical protein [Galbibacter sp. BG1]QLE01558.1 hypothetical protein HX109_08260 [Galbibacter sp. BG1]
MENSVSIKLPWWFWLVAILALLWNLMGIGAFILDVTISEETLSAMPDVQREMYENNPLWSKLVYGTAVFTGFIGALGLLMKKKWAKPVFIISLIAILVQMGFSLFVLKTPDAFGPMAYIIPVMVILIAAFLVAFANRGIKKGWLR